jgi:hypothetical protein
LPEFPRGSIEKDVVESGAQLGRGEREMVTVNGWWVNQKWVETDDEGYGTLNFEPRESM